MDSGNNTHRQDQDLKSKSKNSSIDSGKEAYSLAPSSKYSGDSVEIVDHEDIGELQENISSNNNKIVKRPSMYHSESSAIASNNNARTSRRQSLLSKRSQNLQQVEESSAPSVSVSSNSDTSAMAPKFVVTNPDPVSNMRSDNSSNSDDLKNFVNLMNSKGSKLSSDEIAQLKTMGKIPGFKRASMLSQYSGVVEEVAEVQHILPEKSQYVPSLIEVASTVHKRAASSNDDSSKSASQKTPSNKANDDDVDVDDVESVKSVESIVNLGPLPTTTMAPRTVGVDSTETSVRSPDLSHSTEINPTIPPRSSRRPRSEIVVSPSSLRHQQQQQQSPSEKSPAQQHDPKSFLINKVEAEVTPTRQSKRSSIIRKRYSLPPPTVEAPMTPSQIKDLQTSGFQNSNTSPYDYAAILKSRGSNLQDRRRISSANRPLPEVPNSADEEEDDDEEDDTTNDIIHDQNSEKLLNLQSGDDVEEDANTKSIISDETVASKIANSVHSPLGSDQGEEAYITKPIIGSEQTDSPISNGSGKKITFDNLQDINREETSGGNNYKYGGQSYSVSSFNTDNASYHTADEAIHGSNKEIIRTNDMSKFENDDNYEDIEVLKTAEQEPRRTTSHKKHKKKSLSSSSSNTKKLRPFSISTLSKLLESTDGVIIGEEFESLDISNDEKKYIEKIVDVIARLTADMVADPSRHDGTITRMKAALRILEGFE